MSRSSARTVLLVLAALLLVALAVGSSREGGDEAYDPESSEPLGTLGLVVSLQELGARVDVVDGAPPDEATAALVLRDRLIDADRDGVRQWVEDGGVLLVTDPFSELADGTDDGPCPSALADVGSVALDEDTEIRRGEGRCFDGAVTTGELGDGDVVTIATPEPLTNALLGEADNALLATALLAPTPADARVVVLDGPSVEAAAGDEDLVDLVGRSVRQALFEAGVAVVLWVLWRARRLGRPVREDQPVEVAGSELVVAVGRLLDSRRRPDEAAAILRADVRRVVDARLGLPPGSHVRAAAAAVAARTEVDEARAAAALGERPVHTDDDLLAVAADLDRIRTELRGSPSDRPTR